MKTPTKRTPTKRSGKRFAIAAAALALVSPFAATAASADPYNGYGYNDHRGDNRINNNGWNQRGSYQNGWNNQFQRQHNWRRGDRLSAYDQSHFRAFDYRREHFREPPRGYRYVRDDRGDTLLVGILTGVVLSTTVNGDRY